MKSIYLLSGFVAVSAVLFFSACGGGDDDGADFISCAYFGSPPDGSINMEGWYSFGSSPRFPVEVQLSPLDGYYSDYEDNNVDYDDNNVFALAGKVWTFDDVYNIACLIELDMWGNIYDSKCTGMREILGFDPQSYNNDLEYSCDKDGNCILIRNYAYSKKLMDDEYEEYQWYFDNYQNYGSSFDLEGNLGEFGGCGSLSDSDGGSWRLSTSSR